MLILGSTFLVYGSFHLKKYDNLDTIAVASIKYKEEYLVSNVNWPRWTGNIKKCKHGTIPNNIKRKALMRINYFRTLCGLYPVELSNEYNNLAQQAAFIITANNKLSHHPDENWECYSKVAANACIESSIQYSRTGLFTSFIGGFVEDLGSQNTGVPHRRSLLNSKSGFKGYGSTGYAEAIYNTERNSSTVHSEKLPLYIAYPIAGYNEIGLVYPRWSFGIPDRHKVDFSNSNISLKDQDENEIGATILPYKDIYDPTIVWELKENFSRYDLLKKEITVEVKNVKVDGTMKDYKYIVKFFEYPEDKE